MLIGFDRYSMEALALSPIICAKYSDEQLFVLGANCEGPWRFLFNAIAAVSGRHSFLILPGLRVVTSIPQTSGASFSGLSVLFFSTDLTSSFFEQLHKTG